MKKLVFSILVLFIGVHAKSQELAPYLKVGETNETIQQVSTNIIDVLKSNSFTVLGAYNPSNKSTLKVIVFTRSDLKYSVLKVKDRGALAAVYKVGLVRENGKTIISYSNPEYILRAYIGDNYHSNKTLYEKFSSDIKTVMSNFGSEFTPFGGTVKADKLKKYHYKIMMPYFSDPVTLNEYGSFEEGLSIIENNLKARKGNAKQVYKLVFKGHDVAVFGIGLMDKEEGESHFLPKIGEENIAAMPYEIILQGNKATMLHGKYRLALHWPNLTMGTFMKIISTPGDIENFLETICVKESNQ